MKHIEIEIKFPLKNGNEIIEKLNKEGKFKFEERQIDTYYNAPHRNFVENRDNVSEWLRLRESNGKYSITYKNWYDGHCDEYETEISSLKDTELLLNALNFEKLITVDKIRKCWLYKDVEISIDTVKDLGDYIELEYKGDLEDIEEAKKYLFHILEDLKAITGERDKRGYPYELLNKFIWNAK